MRTLILSFCNNDNSKCTQIIKKLESCAIAKGHQVDVKNAKLDKDSLRLTMYEYIAIVVPANPFSGKKVPDLLAEVLSTCGTVTGKKTCALVIKRGLFSEKCCQTVMRKMEKEGMFIDYFEVIKSVDHAAYVGKQIG